eukprot:COSAG06_NODE_1842_length_8236_cov_57.085904_6_plen_90_part_00
MQNLGDYCAIRSTHLGAAVPYKEDERLALHGEAAARKTTLSGVFLPNVCPETVLAKWCITIGIKKWTTKRRFYSPLIPRRHGWIQRSRT